MGSFIGGVGEQKPTKTLIKSGITNTSMDLAGMLGYPLTKAGILQLCNVLKGYDYLEVVTSEPLNVGTDDYPDYIMGSYRSASTKGFFEYVIDAANSMTGDKHFNFTLLNYGSTNSNDEDFLAGRIGSGEYESDGRFNGCQMYLGLRLDKTRPATTHNEISLYGVKE